MSTCPNKDIHSIYLDNELPANFLPEYEEHIKTCEACQKQLQSLRNVRNLFQKGDSSVINFASTDKEKDDGYARLQARLSYSKITGKTSAPRHRKYTSYLGYMATGVAAALVVALVMPTRTSAGSKSNQADASHFQPIAKTSLEEQLLNRSYMEQNKSSISLAALAETYGTGRSVLQPVSQTLKISNPASFASYELLGTTVSNINYTTNTKEGFTEFYEMELKRMEQEIQQMNFIFTFNSLYNNDDYYIGK